MKMLGYSRSLLFQLGNGFVRKGLRGSNRSTLRFSPSTLLGYLGGLTFHSDYLLA